MKKCLSARVLTGIGTYFWRQRRDPQWLVAFLEAATTARIDVAYLQGCTGVHDDRGFRALLSFLSGGVWAVNLGELQLSEAQLARLLECIQVSDVTHMFYECDNLPAGYKERFRDAIRSNRTKHSRWKLSSVDNEGKRSIVSCLNMWFDPIKHTANLLEHSSWPRDAVTDSGRGQF